MTVPTFDVAVAGAGLPGLALATAAARGGLRVALADASPIAVVEPPADDVDLRVYAVSPGSATFLRAIGAWQRLDPERIRQLYEVRGAIDAQSQVGLMLNVKRDDLAAVLAVLPALNSPTVSQLSNSEWVAVNTIVEERVARDVIPRLKAAKATGIVEYPLNKVVL